MGQGLAAATGSERPPLRPGGSRACRVLA